MSDAREKRKKKKVRAKKGENNLGLFRSALQSSTREKKKEKKKKRRKKEERFSGDALTVLFPAVDDYKLMAPPSFLSPQSLAKVRVRKAQ